MKFSDLLKILLTIKDRYEWFFDGGRIRCRMRGRRAMPLTVAVMRVLLGRPNLRLARNNSWASPMMPIQFVEPHRSALAWTSNWSQNYWDFMYACAQRRETTARQRWMRKLIIQTLGLGADDE